MADKFDMGNIVARCKFNISKRDDINSLYKKFHKYGLALFKKTFSKIKNGKTRVVKQQSSEGSYFGKRKPEDGLIKLDKMNSIEIYNLVRAVTYPYPGAYAIINNIKFIFWRADIINTNEWSLKKGECICKKNVLYIRCKDKKILKITEFDFIPL
jgi:methionyl-tRNA formyltransferase